MCSKRHFHGCDLRTEKASVSVFICSKTSPLIIIREEYNIRYIIIVFIYHKPIKNNYAKLNNSTRVEFGKIEF